MLEANKAENKIVVRPPRVRRRAKSTRSAGALIGISKLTFDKYIHRLIKAGVPLEQIRVQVHLYFGKEHMMRQDLVKQIIAKVPGDLCSIKEGSIEYSLVSRIESMY